MTKATDLAICVPTLNAEDDLAAFINGLKEQSLQPGKVLIIDSSSTDNTVESCEQAGFDVVTIPRETFNHGGTRRMAVSMLEGFQYVLFFTQDAYLAEPDSIKNLLKNFEDPRVAAAYGKQLPRPDAGPLEAFDRHYNYGDQRLEKSLDSIPTLGFKTIFCSNSFCCYRRSALIDVGSFPEKCDFGEDTLTAAKLIKAGHHLVYDHTSKVYHSHNLSMAMEYNRYHAIGIFHRRSEDLFDIFSGRTRTGTNFLIKKLLRIAKEAPRLLPKAMLQSVVRVLGYSIGRTRQIN